MQATLIFPHQLFEAHPGIKKENLLIFLEHPFFFTQRETKFLFHQQKIVFHKATMSQFAKRLLKEGYQVVYLECDALEKMMQKLQEILKKDSIVNVLVSEWDDHLLQKSMEAFLKEWKVEVENVLSKGFLTKESFFRKVFPKEDHFSFQKFYIAQRKHLQILVDSNLKPLGGKWSFDQENRHKIDASIKVFPRSSFLPSVEVEKIMKRVSKEFSHHVGSVEGFSYPTTHEEARKELSHFLEKRLFFFGKYQDAMLFSEDLLFHSLLSPLLNVGLLTPQEVLEKLFSFTKKHKIPLSSLEGFVRQLMGWREFVRAIYHRVGKKQRKSNFFHHKNQMPSSFYEGNSGIFPIDHAIEKLKKSAYLHHIERLMVVGNFFFLCEIDPNLCYQWFMEFFIDSYDWVMVPNLYGMSQYADGGLMTTKPYFSSSNYLLKMGDFPKGDWSAIWDGLFWRKMKKEKKHFQKIVRIKMLLLQVEKQKEKIKIGQKFLDGKGISHRS